MTQLLNYAQEFISLKLPMNALVKNALIPNLDYTRVFLALSTGCNVLLHIVMTL